MSSPEPINITTHKRHNTDTGSPEVTVAQWTKEIQNLTKHLQRAPKDYSARRGLSFIISKRRKALDYLKRVNVDSYAKLIKMLNIRR
ncbi:MAG: 30S ribosomal protein S15 [Legionellales bacterium]|nr:30S ribosomal protein S15 [Legionellales bacterium]